MKGPDQLHRQPPGGAAAAQGARLHRRRRWPRTADNHRPRRRGGLRACRAHASQPPNKLHGRRGGLMFRRLVPFCRCGVPAVRVQASGCTLWLSSVATAGPVRWAGPEREGAAADCFSSRLCVAEDQALRRPVCTAHEFTLDARSGASSRLPALLWLTLSSG